MAIKQQLTQSILPDFPRGMDLLDCKVLLPCWAESSHEEVIGGDHWICMVLLQLRGRRLCARCLDYRGI
jgi:hypothetical protein